MKEKKPTYQQLESKLAEAEQIIQTIEHGQADAITSREDVRVLRLREAEEALREANRILREEAARRTELLEQLEAERGKLKAILENSLDGIVVCDSQARILMANPAANKLYGRNVPYNEDYESQRTLDIRYSDGTVCEPRDLPLTRSALDGEVCRDVELAIVHPDGESRDVLVDTAPIRNDSGEITGAVGTFQDITGLKEIERSLLRSRNRLESIAERRTEQLQETVRLLKAEIDRRAQAEKVIRADEEKLRSLASQLTLAEEQQRRWTAMQLHDSVCQLLAFSKRELADAVESVEGPLAEDLKRAAQYLDEALAQSRTLTFDLSPPSLYAFGLESGLEELAEKFSEQGAVQCYFYDSGDPKPMAEQVKVLLYRSVRELLFNASKHAKADRVDIRVDRPDNNIKLVVQDDGRGFDCSRVEDKIPESAGFGLFSIRERLSYIGGRMEIDSKPGQGTRVTLVVPLASQDGKTKE